MEDRTLEIILGIGWLVLAIYAVLCAYRLSKMNHKHSGKIWIATVIGLFIWPVLLVPIVAYNMNKGSSK